MKNSKIKQFSLPFSLNFTNDEIGTPTDLGCVYLCSIYKNLGYATGFETHIIVSKKTMLPITLSEQQAFVFENSKMIIPISPDLVPPIERQIIFDKLAGSNKDIPQEKYFTLRFSEKNRTGVYTPDGKLTIFEGYNPIEADYYCGKNIIAFSPAWSGKYLYFDPITGRSINIASLVPKGKGFKSKEANGDLEICVFKDESTSYDSNIVQRFTVSEDFKLKEVEMV